MSNISPWKSTLLQVYYHTSRPYRWWRRRNTLDADGLPMPVLFYHRVADSRDNSCTITNKNFIKQIDWLRGRFEFISLAEAQRRIRDRIIAPPSIAVTFDDGYSENCRCAIPYLVKHNIPCTYFVTMKNVLDGSPFAHDVAMGTNAPPNTMEQLRAMSETGIEIGTHCREHVDLGGITDERVLYDEVVGPRAWLENELQKPVRYFAFPFAQYMNLNAKVFRLAAEAGYEGVVSGYGGCNWPAGDPFHIERMAVDDDVIRLKNRVTIDPRTARPPRFRYAAKTFDRQSRTTNAATQDNTQTSEPATTV